MQIGVVTLVFKVDHATKEYPYPYIQEMNMSSLQESYK